MKVRGEWNGIPGYWHDDKYSPDGKRWIATQYGWTRVQALVKETAQNRCQLANTADCAGRTQWGDTHHIYGRGGGKRDDRLTVAGRPNLAYACRPCHNEAKIKRRWPREEHHDATTAHS